MSAPPADLLVKLAVDTASASQAAHEQLDAAVATAERLDAAEAAVDQLDRRLADLATPRAVPTVSLSDARRMATAQLEARGLQRGSDELLELIDESAAAQLRRQYTDFAPVRCRLDGTDLLAAGVAGLAAGAVDMFLVRIPRDLKWGDSVQRGSWLTGTLRDLSIPSDNWLSNIARVPFDTVNRYGDAIPGLGPRTHRVHTFGHDPLFGLVLGTLDIMRGTITGPGRGGEVGIAQTPLSGVSNPLEALALEILHLLSDLPTRCGLPLPGWSLLMTSSATISGRAVTDVARQMYLRGYDSWHLLSMATSPAVIELVLRAYWGLRMSHDDKYRRANDSDAALAGTTSVGDHPRFRALALTANGIGAAMNVGKVVAFGGNPLALNYAQWVAFARALLKYTNTELLKPGATSDALIRQYAANRDRLDVLWDAAGRSSGSGQAI